MSDPDELTDADVRRIVREELPKAGWSLLSTVFWTITALFAVLVGAQLVQIALAGAGVATLAYGAGGVLVVGASVYLLYLLHWKRRASV
ncbi:hypothetical protein [Halosegnis rubeus]|uniref:Uncharacterized protein n=1 Tax=Halosegnis rubeus TaxID=2212850 RepID=A0A5N5UL33_9EURY|nr:hypothetical protein [Halosegnis rubeus]KAB7519470.1 hypothetical protein DP108_05065 [Halosegnis rubeus]